jgi:signal transduction histidine kinase
VALTAADPPPLVVPRLTTARAALGLGWLATALALAAVGLTLRKSIEFGARRDGFVSAVTHELRTPLTTFRMYAGMLADGMVEEKEQRKSYLRTLRDEAARLSTTVENVLTFSRLERGRSGAGRPEAMTVDEMLDRVTPPLGRRAEAAGMTLEVSADGVGDTEVHVDVDLLGQVLSNLVDNACKYVGDAAARTVHLAVEIGDGRMDLRVRDHGPGIPPGRASEIFRPFDRAGRPPTDGASGVGLGLSISRGLAREMGGDLTLEPGPGDGACFRLRLPRATAD